MKWIKEIKLIGLKDWFWWVFELKRNELNIKLNLSEYIDKKKTIIDLFNDKLKASDIKEKLKELES